MKYVHCFLRTPLPMNVMVNGVHMTIPSVESIGLQFVPQFILTDTIDPPFTEAKRQSPDAYHFTYMGQQTEDAFLKFCGIQKPTQFIVAPSEQQAPKITSDLSFLVAIEEAMAQYGSQMPIELSTLLGSFIMAEKHRHGTTM